MKPNEPTPALDANDEISALIETLVATEQRLEEVTAGQVDTVAGRDGRTFLLGRAQEQLRHREAGKQAAILNALPAHIALLDAQGFIVSVNEAWRRFAIANRLHAPEHGIGLNYLDVCDRAPGSDSSDAHQVAAGIRKVLAGGEKNYSIEYPCHSPTEQRWFQLTVTPLAEHGPSGAVVMHLNITARKLAADGLEKLSQKTERRERILNSALSSMSDFAQIYDRDGRILYVNQPLLDLWGLTLEAVTGRDFFDLGYPDELAAKLHRQVQEVFETKRIITDDTAYLSPTGQAGWYEYIFSPVFAADGTVEFVVGSTRDITGRKRSEEALRGSEERLRAALTASGTGTFRWDIRSGELSWDESLDALFGIPYGQAIRSLDTFIAAVHPDDRPGVIQRCERCARDGVDFEMEFRVVWPDGSLHWLHDRGKTFSDAAGLPLYMTGACVDITQRKQAEAAVLESESRYHSLFENMLEGYAYCEAIFEQGQLGDFIYLEANSAFEKLTGLKHVVGKKVSEVIPGIRESNRELFDIYGQVVLSGKPEKFETYVEELGLWLAITVYSAEKTHFVAVFDNITARKAVEEALQASEAEFRALAAAMPQMVWITRPDGWNIYFSQQWMDYTGLTLEESLGHGWNKPFHPEDQRRAWDAWQHAVATTGMYSIECRLRRADGIYRWWLVRGVPQLDAAGNILKWFGTCTDIHDLKMAELEISSTNQALRESNEKFHQLADNITDAFWIRSPDMSEVQYVSPAFERIWGRSSESLYANPQQWTDFILPEDRRRVQAAFTALTGDAPSLDIEYRISRPDGEIRWVRVRGFQVHDAAGQLIRHTGIVTDITEQKRASALLIESEQRLTLATESARIGIWDWDVVTNKLVWDAQMYALYGIREQDFSGAYNAWQKGLHPEDRARSEAEITAAVHGVNGFHIEFRVLWPDGEVRHIEAHALVRHADDGSPAHMIGVNWDITERKQAEIRVETLHKELQDASRRAGMAEVATGVLHNVGNVLNSVNVSTSLVVERLRNSSVSQLTKVATLFSDHATDLPAFLTLDERGRRVPQYLAQLALHLNREIQETTVEMQAVAENVDHIKEIINAQQSYAGTFGVLEPLDLRASIDDALRIHASSLNRHHIEIVRNLEPTTAVVVDKHKVLQILVNLISNAKHAMIDSPVKTLTIRTYPSSDGGSQLSIADTGCGIPAENITRMFAHGFTTKKDGHGFGLHSSALAAKEMNTSLIAHSDGVGHGAVFTLVFPPAILVRAVA